MTAARSLPSLGMVEESEMAQPAFMKIEREVAIAAPARDAWMILGEGFGAIAEWAAPIIASSVDGPLGAGVVRTCRIAAVGPVKAGTIRERLLAFDGDAMTFAYEALDGLPGFVASATNHWIVRPVEGGCVVRTEATLELRGVMRLLGCVVAWQLAASGVRVLEELKYRIEHGVAHPRKARALAPSPRS